MNHSEIVSFLWDVENLIRDSFKRGKNQDVILSLTVSTATSIGISHRARSGRSNPIPKLSRRTFWRC